MLRQKLLIVCLYTNDFNVETEVSDSLTMDDVNVETEAFDSLTL